MLGIYSDEMISNVVEGMEEAACCLPESEFKRGFFAALNALRCCFGVERSALALPRVRGEWVRSEPGVRYEL